MFILSSSHIPAPLASERCVPKGVGASPALFYPLKRAKVGLGLYRFRGSQFETVMPEVFISRIEESTDGHLLIVTGERFVELDGMRVVEHPGLANQLGILP